MSSGPDLKSALKSIQLDNYVSLAIVTAIVYDYALNFTREVDYIWCRRWTWVSTMYVLVRYIGLYWGIIDGLAGSTFVPGPVTVSTVIFLVCSWAFPVFLGAADLVMILRVYAVWSQSKAILGVLLFFYVPQIIVAFVFTGIYNNLGTYVSVTITQVLDFAYCNYNNSTTIITDLYFTLPRLILSALLFALAIAQTLRQSVRLYRATRQWSSNEFVKLLMRDGIFYFSMNVVFNITVALQYGPQWNEASLILLSALSFIAFCPLVPRFILDLRELYDRDLGGRWQGIDTAFGVSSEPISIAFAEVSSGEDATAEEDLNDSEAIPLAIVGTDAAARQV